MGWGGDVGARLVVAVVAAHGGAGVTTAAVTLAETLGRGVCLVDADLGGSGDVARALELPERPGDVGLAGLREIDGPAVGSLLRRTAFGALLAVSPRADLAWLLRDGAVREAVREAARDLGAAVIDAGRPVGPVVEAVADADVVLLVGHAHRYERLADARVRLARIGVEDVRIVEVPTAAGLVERAIGRVRSAGATVDVTDGEALMVLVEGRMAAVGPRGRP